MDLDRSNMLRHEVDEQRQTVFRDQQVVSGIVIQGSSRLHIGHNYHVTCQCPGPDANATSPSSQAVSCQPSILGQLDNSNSRRKGFDDDTPTRSFPSKKRLTLDVVLHSLGKFSESRPVVKNGEECGEILARLTIILDLFKQVEVGDISHSDVSNRLRAFRNNLERVTQMNINRACPRQQFGTHSQADSKMLSITCDTWQITFTTKVVKSFDTDGDLDLQTCYTLHVQPVHGFNGPLLAVISGEMTNNHQYTSLHPIILAYNEYPHTAKIFELIAVDDLDGFVKYLAGERGSLRDCDKDGRSLLFVRLRVKT